MGHAARLNSLQAGKPRAGIFRSGQSRWTNNSPFLDAVPDAALSALTEKATILTYPKQTTILQANQEAGALYIILSGKVRVFASDARAGK